MIGYDSREGNDPFLSENSFTLALVSTLKSCGIETWMTATPTPTPVLSWAVRHYGLGGALILTASHNPPAYGGIKFNPPNGAPAPSHVTKFIEQKANAILSHIDQYVPTAMSIETKTPDRLCKDLPITFANALKDMLQTRLHLSDSLWETAHILTDAAHGAVAETWQALFEVFGIPTHGILCAEPRPDFGGIEPNPTHPKAFKRLQERIQADHNKGQHWDLAIGNDPDGDRHMILDETGHPITPEETAVLLMAFLIHNHQKPSCVVSTLASSGLVKQACHTHQVRYEETPVGFKYFAPFFEEAASDGSVALGVESSGGISLSWHTYEKCGFLPVILYLYSKQTGKPLSLLRQSLSRYGSFSFSETTFTFPIEKKALLEETLASKEIQSLAQTWFKEPITSTDQRDGLKLIFNSGKWVLIRLSGTEPLGRIYAESSEIKRTNEILLDTKQGIERLLS